MKKINVLGCPAAPQRDQKRLLGAVLGGFGAVLGGLEREDGHVRNSIMKDGSF